MDYAYLKGNYRLIAVDLSKQKAIDADPRAIQQIAFQGVAVGADWTKLRLYTILEKIFGHFWGCSRMSGGDGQTPPLPPLSLKSLTHILQWWKLTHPLISAEISIFLQEISKFCYIKKYRNRFHFGTYFLTLLTFLESLKIFLISLVIILMMSAQMAITDLLKLTYFEIEAVTS